MTMRPVYCSRCGTAKQYGDRRGGWGLRCPQCDTTPEQQEQLAKFNQQGLSAMMFGKEAGMDAKPKQRDIATDPQIGDVAGSPDGDYKVVALSKRVVRVEYGAAGDRKDLTFVRSQWLEGFRCGTLTLIRYAEQADREDVSMEQLIADLVKYFPTPVALPQTLRLDDPERLTSGQWKMVEPQAGTDAGGTFEVHNRQIAYDACLLHFARKMDWTQVDGSLVQKFHELIFDGNTDEALMVLHEAVTTDAGK